MSMWNTPIPNTEIIPGLSKCVITPEIQKKIQEAWDNAKPDPKMIEMFRPRQLTFEDLHTPYY